MSWNRWIMIKSIKYYSILVFLIILFLPKLSKYNEYVKIFYYSDQYDFSMISLVFSLLILQAVRCKYDVVYKQWLKEKFDLILLFLFLVTTLISLYFVYQSINDYYFLKNLSVK